MKEVEIHFGIDTSNYTTSVAAVTAAGEVFSAKRLLDVPTGNRGVRQSDALFCHTRDLPEICREVTCLIREKYDRFRVLSVAASTRPRPVEGSYMPCFLAGVNAAKTAADLLSVPFYAFSHQEGHIEAAKLGCRLSGRAFPEAERFFAFHLSGGTAELLEVTKNGCGYSEKIIASALDITIGQLLDRCGVKLGFPFPAGSEVEKRAFSAENRSSVRIPKKENGINLSGFENQFLARLQEGQSETALCGFLFDVCESAVRALLDFILPEDRALPVLFAGGVMSSTLLQERLAKENFYFAPAAFCADNAQGVAVLGKKKFENP